MPHPDLLAVPPARRAAIEGIAVRLEGARLVVLSTHMNADGDGCGSEAALAHLLAQRGHQVRVVNPTPWPGLFGFLAEGIDEQSSKGGKGLKDADALLVVDISDVKRLGILTDTVRALKVPRLVNDHHIASGSTPAARSWPAMAWQRGVVLLKRKPPVSVTIAL
jgi:phosphoesterase RecJ-like protein